MESRKASRVNVKLRIANCGESNSGKTFSASLLAKTINNGSMNGVFIIDTEGRADLYSDFFPGYEIVDVKPPFDPEKLIEALDFCAKKGAKTVIVDSASDFWDRTIQIHREIVGTNLKMSYYAWGKVTPRWDNFRAAITNAPFHVITCWRMKDKVVKKDGELVTEGQRVVARGGNKGIKYDYHIAFLIDENHKARVGKDNLHLFSDWTDSKVIDESIGLKIRDWLNKGGANVGAKQSLHNGATGERSGVEGR